MLNAFLESEEGKAYERPSKEQIKAASEEVVRTIELYLKNQEARGSSNVLQPGRSNLLVASQKKKETSLETQEGQPEKEISFADDVLEREQAAVDVIKGEQNSIKAAKKLLKSMDTSRRMSVVGIIGIITVALVALIFAIFLIKDIVIRAYAEIELELKQSEITIRAGDSFTASDYVKYVTEDESVYIIYPSLDTKDVGEHRLDYVATNGIKNVRKTLTATVIDGESPVIVLTDEEIMLVRNRDEDSFDPMSYIKEMSDNLDQDLEAEVNPLDWSKDEQSLSYRVKDSSGNVGKAILLVKIEDKAICDRNAIYNSTTNTCKCKSGYTGDGHACSLIQSSPASSGSDSSSSGSSNSGSGSSSSGTSSSESWTIDYTDYQPSNGQTDVTYTNNDTGESYTVSDGGSDPYESDEDLWAEIDNLGN